MRVADDLHSKLLRTDDGFLDCFFFSFVLREELYRNLFEYVCIQYT